MLSIHPLNQTPRCWNAFGGKCGEIGETTTVRGSVASLVSFFSPTVKQRRMFFMLFTLHQTSSCGPRRCPQWRLTGFLSSLSDGFCSNLWKWEHEYDDSAVHVWCQNPRCMQNPVSRVQIHANSHDFPWGKVAYWGSKLKEYKNRFFFFLLFLTIHEKWITRWIILSEKRVPIRITTSVNAQYDDNFCKTTFVKQMRSHFRANWQVIMIESNFSEFQPKCLHALMPTGKAPSVPHSINILPFSFLDKCVLDEQVLFHYLP